MWSQITLAQDFTPSTLSQLTREGISEARKRGVQLGRPRLQLNLRKIRKFFRRGLSDRQVATRLKVSRATVMRIRARMNL